MDAVASRVACRREELIDVEVGARAASPEGAGRVDVPAVETRRVVLGEDAHRLDAEVGRRARDANGDLAPVGDQQTCEAHRERFLHRTPAAAKGPSGGAETIETGGSVIDRPGARAYYSPDGVGRGRCDRDGQAGILPV